MSTNLGAELAHRQSFKMYTYIVYKEHTFVQGPYVGHVVSKCIRKQGWLIQRRCSPSLFFQSKRILAQNQRIDRAAKCIQYTQCTLLYKAPTVGTQCLKFLLLIPRIHNIPFYTILQTQNNVHLRYTSLIPYIQMISYLNVVPEFHIVNTLDTEHSVNTIDPKRCTTEGLV